MRFRYCFCVPYNLSCPQCRAAFRRLTRFQMKDTKNYCIHCRDTQTGQTGCFFYEKTPGGFLATSPVFADLQGFYQWAHANGWASNTSPMLTMSR